MKKIASLFSFLLLVSFFSMAAPPVPDILIHKDMVEQFTQDIQTVITITVVSQYTDLKISEREILIRGHSMVASNYLIKSVEKINDDTNRMELLKVPRPNIKHDYTYKRDTRLL